MKPTDPIREDRERRYAELAASLPTDAEGRRAALMAAIRAYDAAIIEGDELARRVAEDGSLAVMWAVNGGTLFGFGIKGCSADQMQDECAAIPGEVPLWGQRGEFLLIVDGMRVRVTVEPHLGSLMPAHIGLHSVDHATPFISDTGYRSCWQTTMIAGLAVDETARRLIEQEARKGRTLIAQPYRKHRDEEPAPAWIDGGSSAAPAFYEDRGGQVAFAF